MSIAVVVLTHDRVHLLRRCVENVLARTSEATTEILIWDNASSDGTSEYLDALEDPRLRVVHSPRNIGQNAYAEAFPLTSGEYLVELDDDVIDAPANWDARLLEAFRALPRIGFLAADLVDDPHDQAANARYRERPHEYTPVELNGVPLLEGPTGGGCAMTSRAVHDAVGGFPQQRGQVFWLEDAAYIERIKLRGYRALVLADLKVHHAGGPYYAKTTPERDAFWSRHQRAQARKDLVKRVLLAVPFFGRLNARYRWFMEPAA